MKRFKYSYMRGPIDFWEGATIPNETIVRSVLNQLPDIPRDGIVYCCYVPVEDDPELKPIYMVKRDNNGDVFFYADWDFSKALKLDWPIWTETDIEEE